MIATYPYVDFDPFYQPTSGIVCQMLNFSGLSEIQLKWAYKSFALVLESRICNILGENQYLRSLLMIIREEKFPHAMKLLALRAVNLISQSTPNKKKIATSELVQTLTFITQSSFRQETLNLYDREIRLVSVRCLTTLGGVYNRKMYIPGETRENDRVRRVLI